MCHAKNPNPWLFDDKKILKIPKYSAMGERMPIKLVKIFLNYYWDVGLVGSKTQTLLLISDTTILDKPLSLLFLTPKPNIFPKPSQPTHKSHCCRGYANSQSFLLHHTHQSFGYKH